MISNKRVPPTGNPAADIAVFGEAPGADEEAHGQPFVGHVGKVQNNFMNRVGIIRSDVYLSNIYKYRPERNDISQYIKFNRAGKPIFESDEHKDAMKELHEELKEVKANVLVASGNIALYALTGKYFITKWRGSILQSRPEFGNRKVIPTVHPSAVARAFGKNSAKTVHTYRMDWERIKHDSAFPELQLPTRTLHIDNSYDEVMQYLHRCLAWQELLGFDIESTRSKSTGWEMSSIQFALGPSEAMCITLATANGEHVVNTYSTRQEMEIMRLAAAILESKKVTKVGQNLIYDNYFMFRKYGIVVQNWHDTRIAHKVCYPEMPSSLAFMCSIYTREPYYKDDGKQNKLIASDDSFKQYAARDAAVCCEIHPRLMKVLERLKNVRAYSNHVKSQQMIIYMMEKGIRVNTNGIKHLQEVYEKRITNKYNELQEICHSYQKAVGATIEDVRPTSNPNKRAKINPLGDIAKYFYVTKNITPYYKRRKSKDEAQQVTVDDDALKRLVRKGHTEARLILEYRRLRKFKSTYINVKLRNGRFAGALDPVGTRQARMSGKKNSFGEGTNPQNLPKKFRRVFQADPGCIFIEIDGSQAENRTVANIAPIPSIIAAFRDKTDVHSLTASFIFEKPINEISRVEGSASLGDGTHSERDWGKRANHAFNYGYGEESFAQKYEIPIEQARKIKNGWLAANKGIDTYWRTTEHKINEKRMLTNPFGRTTFFMGSACVDLYRTAYSCIPQTTVADYILERGMCFFIDNAHVFAGFQPQNQVHDALWYQVSLKIGPERIVQCLKYMKQSFEQPIIWEDTSFIIPADFKIGKSYGRLHDFNPMAPNAVAILKEMYY